MLELSIHNNNKGKSTLFDSVFHQFNKRTPVYPSQS